MKILLVTAESSIDHCFTMIKELRKHSKLSLFITAKKITPEIKEYCAFADAVFFRRRSFINPFKIFADLGLIWKIRKEKAELVWFSGMSLYQALFAGLIIKNFIINVHDVELHPGEKDYHGIMMQKIIYIFYKKHIAVMSRRQSEIFRNKFNTEPFMLQHS